MFPRSQRPIRIPRGGPGAVYQWVHEQKIPHYKIGGLVKFGVEKMGYRRFAPAEVMG